jgi:hypothetical protein
MKNAMPLPSLNIAVDQCVTLAENGLRPSVAVLSAPHGKPRGSVANDRFLTVVEDRDGWLRISAPKTGWVAMSSTHVQCGTFIADHMDVAPRLLALHAITSPSSADTLVRLAAEQNMYGAIGVGHLMGKNPRALIDALGHLPPDVERSELRLSVQAAATRADVSAFSREAALLPKRTASKIWRDLVATCDQAIKAILGC